MLLNLLFYIKVDYLSYSTILDFRYIKKLKTNNKYLVAFMYSRKVKKKIYRFNPATFLCLSQAGTWISNTTCLSYVQWFYV